MSAGPATLLGAHPQDPVDEAAVTATAARWSSLRRRRSMRRRVVLAILALVVVAAYVASLTYGRTYYPLQEVYWVIAGYDRPGSYTVGQLRLPRASLALFVGLAFGLSGVAFQTLLRNPLASPDIIGITTGSSAAAAVAIVTFQVSRTTVSVVAVLAGLCIASAVFALAFRRGVSGTRFVLIGLGMDAIARSVVQWQLERASNFEVVAAMRWMTGSLNGANWSDVEPVLWALVIFGGLILSQTRNLAAQQLGDDTASALGVRVQLSKALVVVAAVGLICFATAAAGPIAFVAFLSGPIAARLIGPNGSVLLPAALVGAALVLIADLAGQYAFATKLPVGVITGVLGAPFLLFLIVRINRSGGSL